MVTVEFGLAPAPHCPASSLILCPSHAEITAQGAPLIVEVRSIALLTFSYRMEGPCKAAHSLGGDAEQKTITVLGTSPLVRQAERGVISTDS